jgi:predicted transposase YdaD
VSKVRELTKALPDRTEAITEAVKYCLDNGILVNILSKISSEVVNMLMTEFNIEDAKKIWREEGYEDGIEKGIEKGKAEGKAEGRAEGISQMVRLLKEAGVMNFEEISRLSGLSVVDIENL